MVAPCTPPWAFTQSKKILPPSTICAPVLASTPVSGATCPTTISAACSKGAVAPPHSTASAAAARRLHVLTLSIRFIPCLCCLQPRPRAAQGPMAPTRARWAAVAVWRLAKLLGAGGDGNGARRDGDGVGGSRRGSQRRHVGGGDGRGAARCAAARHGAHHLAGGQRLAAGEVVVHGVER